MHILIIPSERYVPAGSPLEGIFQQHQAKALSRAGHTVGVLSPPELWSIHLIGRVLKGHPSGIREEIIDGLPVLRCYGWIPPRISSRWLWLWFWQMAGRRLYAHYVSAYGSPDVIHAHNARFAGILAEQIKREYHIPYVLTEHSSEYARNLIPGDEMKHLASAFRNADARIVVSPGLGAVLERVVGDSSYPWQYIPNILDNKFEYQNIELAANKTHDLEFCFLNVGALVETKGQADLLHAFAARFSGDRTVTLRIGGDGELRPRLEELSSQLGISQQVSFLGELQHEQVLKEMRQCDAYVHSSHYETFGVVVIEALACGKPVVSTTCGGPEYIVKSHNGVLVPVGDIDALGNAMAEMHITADRYDKTLIRQDCIAQYGERAVITQLSQLYRALGSSSQNRERKCQ